MTHAPRAPAKTPAKGPAKAPINAPAETPAEALNWRNCWYPVAFLQDLPRDRPTGFTLYDEPLMLYFDGSGQPVCLQDRCPHRAARLSDGVVRDGQIECLYHGWQFDGEGTCTHIPQWVPGTDLPIRSCVRSYPVTIRRDIVWIWAGEAEAADPALLPVTEQPADPDLHVVTFQMDLPYDQSYLIENVIDVAHIHIAHDGVRGGGLRAAAKPLEFDVTEMTAQGFSSTFRSIGLQRSTDSADLKGARVDFVAPNLIRYTSEYARDDLLAGLELYSIPLGRNRCRLLYRKFSNFNGWRERIKPRWMEHQVQCLILEQDMSVVVGQAEAIERHDGPLNTLWLPLATSDRLVVAYRKWIDRYGAALPFYRGFQDRRVAPPSDHPEPQGRTRQHTDICATCARVVRRTDQASLALKGLIALCVGLALLSGGGAAALPWVVLGALALAGVWGLSRFRARF